MYILSDIAMHRDQKLESLLSDRIGEISTEFKFRIQSCQLLEQSSIFDTLEFVLRQNYGMGLNTYYVTHPIRVANFVIDWMKEKDDFSTDFIRAALIHNVIEKQVMTKEEIQKKYGADMAHIISVLTQDRSLLKDPDEKAKYYQRIYGLSRYGQLLKFFDKLDNLYAICLNPSAEVRKEYIDEIQEKVRPIAVQFYPEVLIYFDALILEMKSYGHYDHTAK